MATNEANKQENMSIQNRVTCEYGGEKKKKYQRYVSLFCSLSVYFVKQRTQLNESTHYKTENKTATTNHLHITHSPFSFISTFSYYTIPYYTDTREFVAVSFFSEYICCFLFATEFITLRRSLFLFSVCVFGKQSNGMIWSALCWFKADGEWQSQPSIILSIACDLKTIVICFHI